MTEVKKFFNAQQTERLTSLGVATLTLMSGSELGGIATAAPAAAGLVFDFSTYLRKFSSKNPKLVNQLNKEISKITKNARWKKHVGCLDVDVESIKSACDLLERHALAVWPDHSEMAEIFRTLEELPDDVAKVVVDRIIELNKKSHDKIIITEKVYKTMFGSVSSMVEIQTRVDGFRDQMNPFLIMKSYEMLRKLDESSSQNHTKNINRFTLKELLNIDEISSQKISTAINDYVIDKKKVKGLA